MAGTNSELIASRVAADRAYRLKQFAAVKKRADDCLATSIRSIIDCDEDLTAKRAAVRESAVQYITYLQKTFAADAKGDGADFEDEDTEVESLTDDGDDDDDADDGNGGGGDGRHALEKLADLLVASGSHGSRAEALDFLLHDKRGTALAQRHKREDTSMNGEQRFEKALHDHGVIAICKHAVEQGFAPCSEHALTQALTKYAVEEFKLPRDQAFAKLYSDELVVRQAIQVAKAFPNQLTVMPMFVGGAEALAANDPQSALAQIEELVEEARKRAPFKKTTAQLFAEVYRDNPELAAREREENRPRGHPSFAGFPPAAERGRVR